MEVFYHGSNTLFEHFDLSHALEGNGKIKFGYGVYVTSHYDSAAHYASVNKEATDFYVYTLEVPELKEGNYIAFKQCVHPEIVCRTEEKLEIKIPEKELQDGKLFRKFLAKKLTGKVDFQGEKAAAEFLDSIGVVCIVWPYRWSKPEAGTNRAIFDTNKIKILKVEKIEEEQIKKKQLKNNSFANMNSQSIAPFIQEYYPQYYSIESYPAAQCVTIRKVAEEWGLFCNFARTPIVLDGVIFKSSELLFQLMKFQEEEPVRAVFHANNPKMTAKKWQRTHRRPDWGSMIVDAMKFCLQQKYEQNENFRQLLEESGDKFIVEDQTYFRKKNADTWGTKLCEDHYTGPNLLGRLLMELRENKRLDYHLPADTLDFIHLLKNNSPCYQENK